MPGWRRVRQIGGQGFVKLQLAIIDQEQDESRNELLSHRGRLKEGGRSYLGLKLDVSQPISGNLHGAPILHNSDRDAGTVLALHFGHHDTIDRVDTC
jgi:hypothetical protein